MGGLLQTALHLYPVPWYLVYKMRPFYSSTLKVRILNAYLNPLWTKLFVSSFFVT